MNPANASELRAALQRHGFRFSKSKGQNFLIYTSVPRRIAEASGADGGSFALEIGPGAGSLTVELSARAAKVCAVELDASVLPLLHESLEGLENVEVVNADALKLDLCKLISERAGGLSPLVCANLPYSITSPLLAKIIDSGCFRLITVMIQREVAQRLCAKPGTPERIAGQDFLWFLWCGRNSPLFGRQQMTTFERLFVADKATHAEPSNPYYRFVNDTRMDRAILAEFGLDQTRSHIVNGHVPVKTKDGGLAAHFEHSVAILKDRTEIMTIGWEDPDFTL